MKILITNDDGIQAPGISILTEIASKFGEVYVVAPHQNNSAVGHGITMRRPLKCFNESIPHAKFSVGVDGTPADCVKYALAHLNIKPDLVMSGINDERNCGTDILYSGTVSGAIEGNLCGYPAIAVSTSDSNFDIVVKELPNILSKLLTDSLSGNVTLNINFPNSLNSRGIKITTVGETKYAEQYVEEDGGHRLSGPFIDIEQSDNTDVKAVINGYVSITPLKFNFNDINEMNQLKNKF